MRPTRVLIVDDSAFMRLTLSKRLAEDEQITIAGTASNGEDALAQLHALKPDVITLDVEMPRLDGFGALVRIMAERPTPVIMVSSLTQSGTETAARALTLGAVDCVAKPAQIGGNASMVAELAAKIRQACGARVQRSILGSNSWGPGQPDKARIRAVTQADSILVIGSSTGGPSALRSLLGALPIDLNAAVVIVQHMPAGFTRSLASHLNDLSGWTVQEAAAGDRLLCGQALLAPGSYHLVFSRQGEAALTQDPPINNVRPSVDVTMRSLVEHYGRRMLGVVLTGMGRDGADGAVAIHRAGGRVVTEAESTCAVYGMPRSVVEAGVADHVAPLHEIPALLSRLLKGF